MKRINFSRGAPARKTLSGWLTCALVCAIALCLTGCEMFEVESPRPQLHQVDAAKEIVNSNVPVIVGAQTNKQDNIKFVAEKALTAIKESTPAQVDGITNITANAFEAIKDADGTAKNLSKVMGNTNKSILEMSAIEYLGYAGMQGQVAMQNRDKLYSGIKSGWQWTNKTIGLAATGTVGGGGLIAFALNMLGKANRRKKLLVKTGSTVERFAAANPTEGEQLKNALAKDAAGLAVDAKKEFDI